MLTALAKIEKLRDSGNVFILLDLAAINLEKNCPRRCLAFLAKAEAAADAYELKYVVGTLGKKTIHRHLSEEILKLETEIEKIIAERKIK